MEKVYVWGLGFFYKCNANKIDSIFEVCGFIDNGKKGDESDQYGRILGSNEITADMTILVMTKSFIPLLAELAKKNIKRVIVGMTIFPESYQEKLLAENGQILIKSGKVIYQFNDGNIVDLNSEKDLSYIFNRLLADKKIFENINTLPVIPTCRDFGISRGTPIDRYYIENFLNENKLDIKGSVLEIAENTYTRKYGDDRVTQSFMLHVKGWGDGVVAGNLETGEGIESNAYDCAIITQTLMFIYDIQATVENIYKMLKTGGVALITVAGISQISRYDAENWGSYWNFQGASVQRLFEQTFEKDKISIVQYGNVKTATAFLYGICAEEIDTSDYEYDDPQYPLIIGIRVEK